VVVVVVHAQTSCLREVRESQKVFSALVNSMEKNHKAVVAAIEERQVEEEHKVERLVQELQQEIRELRSCEQRRDDATATAAAAAAKYGSQILRSGDGKDDPELAAPSVSRLHSG